MCTEYKLWDLGACCWNNATSVIESEAAFCVWIEWSNLCWHAIFVSIYVSTYYYVPWVCLTTKTVHFEFWTTKKFWFSRANIDGKINKIWQVKHTKNGSQYTPIFLRSLRIFTNFLKDVVAVAEVVATILFRNHGGPDIIQH